MDFFELSGICARLGTIKLFSSISYALDRTGGSGTEDCMIKINGTKFELTEPDTLSAGSVLHVISCFHRRTKETIGGAKEAR